jgi:hypothetical protein
MLAALIPPGSVEAEVGRVQAGVFSGHGLVSSLCLPPLVPVVFSPDEPPAGLLHELNRSIPAGYRMRVSGFAWVDGVLYLSLETGGAWRGMRGRGLALCGDVPGLFPTGEGFFLGCGEASDAQRRAISPTIPDGLSFSSCAIALVRIATPRTDGQWWRELSWEIVDERPLRGRREQ